MQTSCQLCSSHPYPLYGPCHEPVPTTIVMAASAVIMNSTTNDPACDQCRARKLNAGVKDLFVITSRSPERTVRFLEMEESPISWKNCRASWLFESYPSWQIIWLTALIQIRQTSVNWEWAWADSNGPGRGGHNYRSHQDISWIVDSKFRARERGLQDWSKRISRDRERDGKAERLQMNKRAFSLWYWWEGPLLSFDVPCLTELSVFENYVRCYGWDAGTAWRISLIRWPTPFARFYQQFGPFLR
jgi:hypothetical protein